MFLRVICIVAFFGLLSEVHSAALNPEEIKEKITNAQEQATVKVITAILVADEAAKYNATLSSKALEFYNAAVNRHEVQIKAEMLRKITDERKKKLENKLNRLTGKNDEKSEADIVEIKDLLDQIAEAEVIWQQKVQNLTDIESAARVEWENVQQDTESLMETAYKMKKEAVKAVIQALEITASDSEGLLKNYPDLEVRKAAQQECVSYFKKRLEEELPNTLSTPLFESMKKLWIKGQKEFMKSSA